MELRMEIGLDQLIQAIKHLPAKQLAKLKAEINNVVPEKTDKESFKAFLLQAPVFTDEQITLIEEARKSMNKWGKN
ncbi:MAG TPA: hypothetical protein VFS25_15775 [Chitinophaga sp.]|uniref:hypothetical protein n=1 Tax=Chitinophaga sp. TaxID=1869181 RepID=UPI002DBCE362|nr:hypothetical protein [Chitinophaga sp.]HEU4554305.1 hypothetical protein [Chitinophaga sp.]